jgi:hypothetical protein
MDTISGSAFLVLVPRHLSSFFSSISINILNTIDVTGMVRSISQTNRQTKYVALTAFNALSSYYCIGSIHTLDRISVSSTIAAHFIFFFSPLFQLLYLIQWTYTGMIPSIFQSNRQTKYVALTRFKISF